ncbi:hypothetical protein A3A55_02175 [Candidatus Roizmanbacteria bacterium RIFCSPLOWO2_01_FULL_40_14]|nr:MAG: hypothetical protein A3A55_02175 [Candidatus Roizmanbacteria bacterium RIFCSPLOWO2_01_FULL_40_14]
MNKYNLTRYESPIIKGLKFSGAFLILYIIGGLLALTGFMESCGFFGCGSPGTMLLSLVLLPINILIDMLPYPYKYLENDLYFDSFYAPLLIIVFYYLLGVLFFTIYKAILKKP